MSEQLDLFYATAMQEEEKVTEKEIQKAHDNKYKQNKLTPREWRLLELIKFNSLFEHRKTTQKEICEKIEGFEWNDDTKAHDHCVAIWDDIKDINLSYETDKLIISDNFEYWIGSEKETKAFLDKLWSDLEPRLKRYWAYLKKARRNGQGQMYDEETNTIDLEIRRFIESYGQERISD